MTVRDGVATRCTTSCSPGGTFVCTSAALDDGPHVAVATQADTAGNPSGDSAACGFLVDTSGPAAPVITSPAFASTLTDATPEIAGSCEAGATVSVFEGPGPADTTTLRCTASCTGAGTCACTTPELAAGPHTFSASQVDTDGNSSPLSPGVDVTIDAIGRDDADSDGVLDDDDDCLTAANPDQADRDHDGLGDVCDRDADGNGFIADEGVGISGGGCDAGGGAPGGGAIVLALGLLRGAASPNLTGSSHFRARDV